LRGGGLGRSKVCYPSTASNAKENIGIEIILAETNFAFSRSLWNTSAVRPMRSAQLGAA